MEHPSGGRGTQPFSMRSVALTLFWVVGTAALAFATFTVAPAFSGHGIDKLLHMAVFAILALLGSLGYPREPILRMFVWLAAFGGLIELIQLIPSLGRDADWSDWLADCISTAVVLTAVRFRGRMHK